MVEHARVPGLKSRGAGFQAGEMRPLRGEKCFIVKDLRGLKESELHSLHDFEGGLIVPSQKVPVVVDRPRSGSGSRRFKFSFLAPCFTSLMVLIQPRAVNRES